MSASEQAFGVPVGHSLRLVRAAPRGRGEVWEWEHEERDRDGRLVAVFESWSRGGGDAPPAAGQDGGAGGFVKYSPSGWVLRRSGADARRRARAGAEKAPPPTTQPPSLRGVLER